MKWLLPAPKEPCRKVARLRPSRAPKRDEPKRLVECVRELSRDDVIADRRPRARDRLTELDDQVARRDLAPGCRSARAAAAAVVGRHSHVALFAFRPRLAFSSGRLRPGPRASAEPAQASNASSSTCGGCPVSGSGSVCH